jgi:hypothetical protein
MAQGGGRIRLAGAGHEVIFTAAGPAVLDAAADAYRVKYAGSPYLAPMIAEGPRQATVRVAPRRAFTDAGA